MVKKQETMFKKKELALAVSVAMFGGLMTGCSSSSDSGVAGNKTINTSGGNGGTGATAYGGDGDNVDFYLYGGLGGVHVKSTGSANTSFVSQQSKATPFLGLNPLEVTSDFTIAVAPLYNGIADAVAIVAGTVYAGTDGVLRTAAGAATAYATDVKVADGSVYRWSGNTNELYTAVGDDATVDLAAAGTVYSRVNNQFVYTADADDTTNDPRITGISIAKNTTLTVENQYASYAYLRMNNDIVNHGTLTTTDATVTDRADLNIDVNGFVSDGTIDTSGSGTVVNGGYVDIWSDYGTFNSGTINTSGADSSTGNGGNAGYIDIESGYYTENTGDLDASGGDSTFATGSGGNADWVYVYSEYGSALNSGNIDSSGGNGDNGGNGDWFGVYNDVGGRAVFNSGDLDISGGDGSAGTGGWGGDVDFYAYGAALANSGDIDVSGGDAAADFNAGGAGDIYFYTAPGNNSWGNGATPQGNIDISGDMNLAGGNASGTGDGGNGGWFGGYVDNYDGAGNWEDIASDQAITLHGYSTIDTTGGDAQFPGRGGDVYLYANYGWDDATYTYALAGPVSNAADINTSGGAYTGSVATAGNGAYGGSIYFETTYEYGHINPEITVTNSGDLTMNGGGGFNATSNWNNYAGGIWAWGYHGVTNTGTITANGGDDAAADGSVGADGYGGYSGWIELYAEMGPVVATGAITANGGNGEYSAGDGSNWTAMFAPEVKAGNITGIGGEADTTLATYYPGYGGWVWLMGTDGPNSVSAGTITLTPGTNYTTLYPDDNGYYKVVGPDCDGDC